MSYQTSTSTEESARMQGDMLCYVAGALAVATGFGTIIAWFFAWSKLIRWSDTSSPLHFNSAVMLVLFGAGVICLAKCKHKTALGLALFAFIIALATLFEIFSGYSLGIDELFVNDYLTGTLSSPGRLSPNSAVCGFFITASMLFMSIDQRNMKFLFMATIFGSLCFAFGLTATLGYLSGIPGAYAWFAFTHMPIQSALLFTLLGKACTLHAWQILRSPENRQKTSILKTIAWPMSLSILSVTTALSFAIYVEESGRSSSSLLPLVCFAFGGIMAVLAGAMSFLWVESQSRAQQLVAEIERRQEIEIQLRRAKEAAQQANEAKSRFLAAVSHEIRSPIGTIIGFADLVKQSDIAPSERARFAEIILRNSRMLLDYVDELLDRQRVESGNIQIAIQSVDVRTIIKEVEELFELSAPQKSISYKIWINPEVPQFISTDPKRLRQVLLNLVSNALKYTEHGQIELNVGWIRQGVGGKLTFQVQDTGIGITEEFKDRIFQPFQRDSAPTTGKIIGTGLGLNISRKLAQHLGGDVELVKTRPGGGSTFCFWLNIA